MRFLSAFGLVGAFATSVVLAAPASNHVLHERSAEHIATKWVKRDRLDARALLPVRIGLTQRNLERGYDLLMEVSSHDSPKYGQHYTPEEVHDLFAPAKESVDAVRAWLESAGISSERISQSVNKQWMQFDAPAEELESLLKTKYHEYTHVKTGKTNVACDEYHVPAHVQEHIDYITPGIKLIAGSRPKPAGGELAKRAMDEDLAEAIQEVTGMQKRWVHKQSPDLVDKEAFSPIRFCDRIVTPACVFALYNITQPTKSAPGNELGIFEDLGDKYAQEDLNLFFQTIAKNIPQGTHPTLKGIDGATAPISDVTLAGGESDLDLQLSYPIIYPQKIVLFQTDDDPTENNYTYSGFLNNFLDAIDGSYCSYSAYGEKGNSPLDPAYPDPLPGGYKGKLQCGVYKPTNVISISYGGQEFDLPASYQKRQCNEYMKLGLQGVSVVLSSGDSGVAGPDGDDNDNGCLGPKGTIFSPDFPATCPYITTLGSTYLPRGFNVSIDAERATDRFPSGGGFSNIYPIPDYQKSAVAGYFAAHNPPYAYYSSVNNNSFGAHGGVYNRLGRAYPDFSALGDNVLIYSEATIIVIGGTSASAPTFASILNRINEERIAAGKSTVGFVNPVLYAHPDVLHDITVGSNPGCGTQGFAAAEGWDPVTGLGTPNYAKMLPLFMGLREGSYRK